MAVRFNLKMRQIHIKLKCYVFIEEIKFKWFFIFKFKCCISGILTGGCQICCTGLTENLIKSTVYKSVIGGIISLLFKLSVVGGIILSGFELSVVNLL